MALNALNNITADNLALFGLAGREDAPYFAALGQFIAAYAEAEAGIHLVIRSLSGMGEEKAREVFGGQRVVDMVKCIQEAALESTGPHRKR